MIRFRTVGLAVILIALLFVSGTENASVAVRTPLGLIKVLENGKPDDCSRLISKRGLTVVESIWLRPGDVGFEQSKSDIPLRSYDIVGSISLKGLDTSYWNQTECHLSSRELRSKRGDLLFRQLADVIRSTQDAYSGSIMASDDGGVTQFEIRHFGPAIMGKICSGSSWNVYYTYEHGIPKIWMIEFDYA